jgi:hypothetical protein
MRYTVGSANVLSTSVEDALKTMALVEAANESGARGAQPIPTFF